MDLAEAYEFLQLGAAASSEEVSSSFRRLLKEYHPDRNTSRSEWSHRMTVRLTEAHATVTEYLRREELPWESFIEEPSPEHAPSVETDEGFGYSLTLQGHIAELYDLLLDQIHDYYNYGMEKLHLREEGALRYRYRRTLRQMTDIVEGLALAAEWPGSALQYRQVGAIRDFAAAFYENMLIRPKKQQVFLGEDQKACQLYRQGADALDQSIREGVLGLQMEGGRVCPAARDMAERSFMVILARFPRSPHTAETLIKLYLLRALTGLCSFLESAAETA
ncbi:DnaJ domain-containing protein [Alkalispirochaeta americana]|uniref:DnaJ domain-containing protein n=1 Tax=Alkalispirochaeta americana TaxID=159291 RepID=A0A1N6VDA5_9SPIO|nr:J domain-containing protein [Alkalispirochaeta americana]SIQ75747.1 DnaJ domain-containing protein [Alkalispirochaeta americana]